MFVDAWVARIELVKSKGVPSLMVFRTQKWMGLKGVRAGVNRNTRQFFDRSDGLKHRCAG